MIFDFSILACTESLAFIAKYKKNDNTNIESILIMVIREKTCNGFMFELEKSVITLFFNYVIYFCICCMTFMRSCFSLIFRILIFCLTLIQKKDKTNSCYWTNKQRSFIAFIQMFIFSFI